MNDKTKNEPTPFDAELTLWEAHAKDPVKAAKPITELRQSLLDLPPHRSAEELHGQTFVIVALKPFESSFIGQDHAYYAGCLDDQGQRFTTVLGGQILVETLDALIAAGLEEPVQVTLREKSGGKYGRYYVFE